MERSEGRRKGTVPFWGSAGASLGEGGGWGKPRYARNRNAIRGTGAEGPTAEETQKEKLLIGKRGEIVGKGGRMSS